MTNCKICNGQLTGRQKETCSRECRIKLDGIKRKESGRLRKANMTPEAYERKRAAAKKDYERNKDKRKVTRACTVCGEVSVMSKYHAKGRPSCTKCWTKLADTPYLINCQQCNKEFYSRKETFKFCTPTCKERATLTNNWITKAERERIYRRDNWQCQICNEPVIKNYDWSKGYNPKGPSLDHITPRSHGGTDEPSNLRLAHHHCNTLRGNKVEFELTP